MDNTKYGNGKGKLLPKIEEVSGGEAHTNICKLIQNILTITDVFLNQKRVNVCEHMVKIASCEIFERCHKGVAREEGGEGGEEWMKRKLNGNYLWLIPGLCLEDRKN